MFVLASFLSNTAFNFLIGLLLARFLGPDQYGRFALAVAIAAGLQTVAFDWARVATTRFFAHEAGTDDRRLRPTVETMLAFLMGVTGGLGLLAVVTIMALPLPRPTMALAVLLAIVNGGFDYWTALIRARFLDRAYARLILSKNALSSVLTLGGALWTGSASVAVLGLGFSMAGGAWAVRDALVRGAAPRGRGDSRLARTLLAYALPVVTANLLYQTIPLADRLLIARTHGFAQSGQFSLAYDIGVRVVSALGSALDVLLFQIAVRADATLGGTEARRQIGINIGIVFAVLLPACVGLWIVLPSFEIVAVPPEFRGPFAANLRRLLPGLFCYGLIFFALNPLFQIGRRTAPLVAVAALAALANLVLIGLWPDRTGEVSAFADVQAVALAGALLLLCAWAIFTAPVRLRARDLLGAGVATLVMVGACAALPSWSSGPLTLALQVSTGAVGYLAIALLLDLCGLRTQLRLRASRKHA